MFRAVSKQYEQALGAAADVLGLSASTRSACSIETTTAPHDIERRMRHTPRRIGRRPRSCRGRPTGTVRPVLVAEEYWTVTDEIPGWDLSCSTASSSSACIVEGSPPLRLELTDRNDESAGSALESRGGQLAVAMTAVRAIPYVLSAPPGVVIPKVFGAYQWPTSNREGIRPS